MYSRHHFPNQKEGEHVLMFLRRHWISLFKILVMCGAMALLPTLIYWGGVNYTTIWDSSAFEAIFVLLTSAYYLFILLFTFTNFLDYYLDVWIVTNKRVINIEQKGLFSRVVSENELSRIQDVTSEIKGITGTFLKYGTVFVQTAAEKERFEFKQVPHADEVARKISNLAQNVQRGKDVTAVDLG